MRTKQTKQKQNEKNKTTKQQQQQQQNKLNPVSRASLEDTIMHFIGHMISTGKTYIPCLFTIKIK